MDGRAWLSAAWPGTSTIAFPCAALSGWPGQSWSSPAATCGRAMPAHSSWRTPPAPLPRVTMPCRRTPRALLPRVAMPCRRAHCLPACLPPGPPAAAGCPGAGHGAVPVCGGIFRTPHHSHNAPRGGGACREPTPGERHAACCCSSLGHVCACHATHRLCAFVAFMCRPPVPQRKGCGLPCSPAQRCRRRSGQKHPTSWHVRSWEGRLGLAVAACLCALRQARGSCGGRHAAARPPLATARLQT